MPIDWKSGNPVPPGTPGAVLEAFKAGTAPGEANAPGAAVVGVDDGTQTVSTGPATTAPQATPAIRTTPGDVGEGTGGLY